MTEENRAPGSSAEFFCATVTSLILKKLLKKVCTVMGSCPFPPQMTERWISRGNGIRLFGALLLELSIPCVWWGGWYYWILFGGLTISGVLRLCFPQSSLRSIWPTYPNWVQTCLLVEGAALMWVLHS